MKPYYQDDAVTIYHGDCRDVLPALTPCVAAVVTSPPYNTLGSRIPDAPSGMHSRSAWIAKVNHHGYADDMDEPSYQRWQSQVAEMIASVSLNGASFFYNHKLRYRNMECLHPMDLIRLFHSFYLRQEIVWSRNGAVAFNCRLFAPSDERIYWLVKKSESGGINPLAHWNQSAASWLSVWNIPFERNTEHPAPFPIEIPSRCITAVTDELDTVLDPFMGSGTTLRAAKDLGRKAIGIEIEERFCELAAKRMRQEVLPLSVSPIERPNGVDRELF